MAKNQQASILNLIFLILSISRQTQDDITSLTWVNLVMQETIGVPGWVCPQHPFSIKNNSQRTIYSHLAG